MKISFQQREKFKKFKEVQASSNLPGIELI
jgi:hypothetical protein